VIPAFESTEDQAKRLEPLARYIELEGWHVRRGAPKDGAVVPLLTTPPWGARKSSSGLTLRSSRQPRREPNIRSVPNSVAPPSFFRTTSSSRTSPRRTRSCCGNTRRLAASERPLDVFADHGAYGCESGQMPDIWSRSVRR
jgi:hypothetical protein